MKKLSLLLFLPLFLFGCSNSQEAESAAADLADLATAEYDLTVWTTGENEVASEKTREGYEGTVTFSKSKDVEDDQKTRVRSITFNNFTKKEKSRLRNILGSFTYTYVKINDEDEKTVTRTLVGEATATRILKDGSEEDVTYSVDLEYTRNPETRCVYLTGRLLWNGNRHNFNNKEKCVTDNDT